MQIGANTVQWHGTTKRPATLSDNSATPLFTDPVAEWIPPSDYTEVGYLWRFVVASHTRTRGTVGYQGEPPAGQNNARLDGSCAWRSYGENPDWFNGDPSRFGELEVALTVSPNLVYLWGGVN